MSTSLPASNSADSEDGRPETEVVVQLLGADPWLRFDLWAMRAWEAAESAVAAASNRSSSGSDEGLDTDIMSMFHAAQIAKDFAEMVNPLIAVSDAECQHSSGASRRADPTVGMIVDTDDLG